MTRIICLLLLVLGSSMSHVASAQAEDLHRITGFRSALFGMSQDEVRAAIAQDFGLRDAAIDSLYNEAEATELLSIVVPALDPGPGAAHVYYIFGATSQTLMHINVVWATSDEPDDDARNRIGIAGSQLAQYFLDLKWKPEGAAAGISFEPGEVMLFAGVDPVDAGVEVTVSGVPMTDAEGNFIEPRGPAVLRIRYMARFGQPDVVTVTPGAF